MEEGILQFGERPLMSPTLGPGLDRPNVLWSILFPRRFSSRARGPAPVPLRVFGGFLRGLEHLKRPYRFLRLLRPSWTCGFLAHLSPQDNLWDRSLTVFLSPCSPRAASGPGLGMETWRRLYSEPQRLPARADPSRPPSKEPPPGLGPWPLSCRGTALGDLVYRGAPAAGTALEAAGREGCL